MENAYYYSRGQRVQISRLESVYLVKTPMGERIAFPGWRVLPLSEDSQLILLSTVTDERDTVIKNLSDLTKPILEAEQKIELMRSIRDEPTTKSTLPRDIDAFPAVIRDNQILLQNGEVIAQFQPSLSKNEIKKIVEESGGKIIRSLSDELHMKNTYLLQSQKPLDPIDLANNLMEKNAVIFSHPNFIEEMPPRFPSIGTSDLTSNVPPNDLFPEQWHLPKIQAPEAWEITRGSSDVIVCIMDSGIESAHESFSGKTVDGVNKLVPGYDFEDEDTLSDPVNSSHGTSCAGVAAGPWGIGRIVGVAPNCRLMSIRRSSSLSEDLKMARAFIWAAEHGADIVNCSFGIDGTPWRQVDVVRKSIEYAISNGRNKKGCVIFWAAGNGYESISTDEWASNENVIAVGASTDQGNKAPYSDTGTELDLCAPSSGGYHRITTTTIGGYKNDFGGTSSAAPTAAGVAALILSVNPDLRWNEVRSILCASADKIDLENGMYDTEGHSYLYGYGQVNALTALETCALLVLTKKLDAQTMSSAKLFANDILMTTSQGKDFLNFLKGRKNKIIKLILTDSKFRDNAARILTEIRSFMDSSGSIDEFDLSDSTKQAISQVFRELS